jgi:hypothetical protein
MRAATAQEWQETVHFSCDKNMLTSWKHDRKRVKSTMEYHSLFLRDVGPENRTGDLVREPLFRCHRCDATQARRHWQLAARELTLL